MQHPLIIAHRGESFEAPENTLSAINLAWKKGAIAVEIDIQLTKDKQIVVFHDQNTKRISGENKNIKNSTLAQLKLLDVGCFKGNDWVNERIPTLKEVLMTIPSHGKLIIEIKSSDRILPILKEVLQDTNLHHHQIEIIAFNASTLAKAKQLMPQFAMLWLLDLDCSFTWKFWLTSKKRLLKKAIRNNFDGIDAFAGKILDKNFISIFRNSGLLVYAWTVNNPKKAEQLVLSGIDGITTDRAYWLKLQLKHIHLK